MVRVEGERLSVTGSISMDNARALLDQALAQLRSPQTIIDLAEVTEIDSSAVALLLEWRREAQRRNIELQVINAPASLRSLGELYGVTELLGAV
jgi:phospholipid transport system transporter-binding protein